MNIDDRKPDAEYETSFVNLLTKLGVRKEAIPEVWSAQSFYAGHVRVNKPDILKSGVTANMQYRPVVAPAEGTGASLPSAPMYRTELDDAKEAATQELLGILRSAVLEDKSQIQSLIDSLAGAATIREVQFKKACIERVIQQAVEFTATGRSVNIQQLYEDAQREQRLADLNQGIFKAMDTAVKHGVMTQETVDHHKEAMEALQKEWKEIEKMPDGPEKEARIRQWAANKANEYALQGKNLQEAIKKAEDKHLPAPAVEELRDAWRKTQEAKQLTEEIGQGTVKGNEPLEKTANKASIFDDEKPVALAMQESKPIAAYQPPEQQRFPVAEANEKETGSFVPSLPKQPKEPGNGRGV